jgi:hypothetical protein
LPYYKFNITKIIYLKLLKKKWQTLKKEKSANGGMISGIIIVACIVGWLNLEFHNGVALL